MTTMETTSAADFLRSVFTATSRTPTDRLLYAEAGLGLGTKPWWPPLIEVWMKGPRPPPEWRREGRDRIWGEAYEFLAAIHADFKEAWQASRKVNVKRRAKR